MLKFDRATIESAYMKGLLFDINISLEEADIYIDKDTDEIWLVKYKGTEAEVDLGDAFDVVMKHAFSGSCVKKLNLGITREIENHAFSEAIQLESVIGDSVKVIGNFSFYDCINLQEVSFKNVQRINESAFSNCVLLKKVEVGDNLKIIKNRAFSCCLNLIDIKLGTVDSIGEYAFYYCTSLESVIATELTILPKRVFSYCINLKTVECPKMTLIYSCAFSGCKVLSNLLLYNDICFINSLHMQVGINPAINLKVYESKCSSGEYNISSGKIYIDIEKVEE